MSKRDLWFKFGRFLTGVTIACFFLPFFGVSCDGLDVVTVSGADMAAGCKPGGLIAEADDQSRGMGGSSSGEMKIDNVPVEPLAIAALGLAVIVFGLSWVRTQKAMTAAFVVSIACLGALIGLWLKVGGDFDDRIGKEMNKEMAGNQIMKDVKVESGSRFGLWMSIGTLLGAAAITGLALKERDRQTWAPPPGPTV
jgi:hypothetical protein